MTEAGEALPSPLLLYDGDCGFCNRMVRFVLDHETAPWVYFAPLQGTTAKTLLEGAGLPQNIGTKSIVVYDGERLLVRSRAALCIMRHLGGSWSKFAKLLGVVPAFLSDSIYRMVAVLRRYLPGNDACRLLTPEERERFLP